MLKDVSFLSFLRRLSLIEGFSTLTLFFVAMPLKYIGGIPMAVTIFGSLHGMLFLWLVATFVLAKDRVPLSTGLMLGGIFGAVIPFGPFVVDRRLKALSAD